jgi:Phage integrase family
VLAMYIGFTAGMRLSEVLNLRNSDIYHGGGDGRDTIFISKEKIDKKKKARGEYLGRLIPIPMCLSLAILNLKYHKAKDIGLTMDDVIDQDDMLFSHRGKPWTADALGQALKSLTAKAQVRDFTFHGFRYTARNRTNKLFNEAETYWMFGWLPGKKTMPMHYAKQTDSDRDIMRIKFNMLSVRMSGNPLEWDMDEFGRRQTEVNHYYESTYPLEYVKRLYSLMEPQSANVSWQGAA